MKINQQYLKDLLIAFEDAPNPDTDITELKERGFDYMDPEFMFHMRLLEDQYLIQRTDGQPGFGFYESLGGPGSYAVMPLRLTAQGHDFIADLRQQEVWSTVKENFKEASMSSLVDIAKQLAQGFAKQKIKQLTGFDPD
ncbi:DUF2513 domain-containing protein [Buttiauxella selenatireducens]|uniref:DUF2513 domain-containing protein n=1 Tax=Buttiauxella selenatireducens TaxID=3073902 RepID=A0ABY9SJ19_9ENTR|nr:DUF2513 domain-containing protein [Buttiauxella sp. R73]WMY76416.1 DUF2513 domain-containing protein [Buttiauxella sp. R73]